MHACITRFVASCDLVIRTLMLLVCRLDIVDCSTTRSRTGGHMRETSNYMLLAQALICMVMADASTCP